MSDIKQKFDPSTHMTKCGKPWRWLDVKGQSIVAVVNGDVEDIYLMIELDGKCCANGVNLESFDLIPITHKPVDLPTNLREEIKYAAMENSGAWVGFETIPKFEVAVWMTGNHDYRQLDCHCVPQDPAGWENSLHIRAKEGWKRSL